jgi:hypothetical protein
MTTNYAHHFLYRLSRRGTVDPYAVTFILTEMRFRGPLFRLCELGYAMFFILVLGREPKVTLGHCQVSFPYWRAYSGRSNLTLFLGVLSSYSSYAVCCSYLKLNRKNTIDEMIVNYNGKPTTLYVEVFRKNLALVNDWMGSNSTGNRA